MIFEIISSDSRIKCHISVVIYVIEITQLFCLVLKQYKCENTFCVSILPYLHLVTVAFQFLPYACRVEVLQK